MECGRSARGTARLAALVGVVVWAMAAGLGLLAPTTAAAGSPAPTKPAAVLHAATPGTSTGTYLVDTTSSRAARRAATQVERAGGTVTQRYTRVLKGFAARMTAGQAKKLRAARGVVTVAEDQKIIAAPCLDCPPGPLTRGSVTNWGLLRLSSRTKVSLEPDQPDGPLYVADSDGQGVTAFVVDSGIDPRTAELAGRVEKGHDFVSGDASGCSRHGTQVGEVIGGERTGVADKVELVPLRVFDCHDEGSWSTVVAALDWAVKHRPDGPAVVNISGAGHAFALGDRAVRATIKAGLPVVVSAGNVHDDACRYSPARVSGALTVAASTIQDRRVPSSNRGRCVDLFAAGQDIVTSSGTVSGTSFAAAHTTGAVARYLENHRRATPAQVSQFLESASTTGALTDTQGAPDRLLYLPAPVAPGAPRDVRAAVDDTANTVSATWREPARAGSAPITSYQVCLIDVDVLTHSPDGQCTTLPPSTRAATLGTPGDGIDIEDGGVYDVRVAAVSKAGSGTAEAEVRLAPAAVLPSAPETSALVDEEAFGVLVWVHVLPQDPAVGPVTGLRISIDRDEDGVRDETVTVPWQGSDFQFYEFAGLQRGTTYRVWSALVTADGAGPESSATVSY
jgi:hypothetical protein